MFKARIFCERVCDLCGAPRMFRNIPLEKGLLHDRATRLATFHDHFSSFFFGNTNYKNTPMSPLFNLKKVRF